MVVVLPSVFPVATNAVCPSIASRPSVPRSPFGLASTQLEPSSWVASSPWPVSTHPVPGLTSLKLVTTPSSRGVRAGDGDTVATGAGDGVAMGDGATLATGEATAELEVGLGSTVASSGEAALLQEAKTRSTIAAAAAAAAAAARLGIGGPSGRRWA